MNAISEIMEQARKLQREARTAAEYNRIRKADPSYPAESALKYAADWAFTREIECRDDLTVELHAIPETDITIRGSFDSGDADWDRKIEASIRRRVRCGDVWAWASVCVVVRRLDTGESATEHLGGCSYADALGFKRGGYYADMVADGLRKLGIPFSRP